MGRAGLRGPPRRDGPGQPAAHHPGGEDLHGRQALGGTHLAMPLSSPRLSEMDSEWGSRPKPSANTSTRWAIAGSAPAMCRVNRQTPTRSAEPEKSWRLSKRGSKRGGRPEVPGPE